MEGSIARALDEMGYTEPTLIQEKVVPLVRNGRDLVGQAQTGTGKTAAFGIPLVEKVDTNVRLPQALVLAPTRELANQVHGEIARLGKYRNIQSVTIYGGQAMSPPADRLGARRAGHSRYARAPDGPHVPGHRRP